MRFQAPEPGVTLLGDAVETGFLFSTVSSWGTKEPLLPIAECCVYLGQEM